MDIMACEIMDEFDEIEHWKGYGGFYTMNNPLFFLIIILIITIIHIKISTSVMLLILLILLHFIF